MTNIVIARDQKANNKQEAIELAGKLLVQAGHVEADYINKMQEREEMLTTYLGNGVAIPHGTNEAKTLIKSTGISIVQLPEGVDFGDGNKARLLIGIAGVGDEHLDILSDLAIVVSEEENVEKLVHATTDEEIMDIIKGGM
ncbi:PTS sugar transporter subunit IIA [Brevibacillus laterosporus]|uniref:PTS sugar transporter subunit IIA n=1 Tax=Brevibacillus laterosporus TaxID=1465 RepID=UPI000B9AC922|nr:PTS sugar transporter subunit IIA [Brevibacillus laterosporus]MBG9773478.1 PTS mannitol transporter subunit IIA [Brevibacillus laterosporus]MBG9790595.1 PTS mannitol transporter subunit IIA [Brevibacillus laterosporus]MBG9796442.1 PTS mannitol transporter subunit IIA [Brevibacillus laterosporus]MCG7316275.1 PTS sugar transporter subunit IIA [Brevibacillus laterosporus]MCR8937458.1 PTS sugar transporter subunit IIA [Brevibacillus laterosporus]